MQRRARLGLFVLWVTPSFTRCLPKLPRQQAECAPSFVFYALLVTCFFMRVCVRVCARPRALLFSVNFMPELFFRRWNRETNLFPI